MLDVVADFFARNPTNPHYGLKVLLVWVLVALFVVVWGSRSRATPGTSVGDATAPPTSRADTTGGRVSHLALLGFLALYVFLILYGSNFTDHDHDFLTLFSVRGELLSPLIWPAEGRFFPLGQQEFNVLQLVTRACQGYHLFAVAELVALLALLYLLLDDLPAPWRLGLMAWLLVVPSFLISFTALILPERNVLFAVVVMVFCVQRHARSGSRVALVGALLAAHLALYCKETTLALLLGFVGARLYLSWRLRRPRTREALAEFGDGNTAELGILVLTAVFALLYAIIIIPSASLGYAETHRAHSSLLSLLAAYLRADLLAGVFAVVAALRLLRAFRRPERADPLWDPLALGGLGWLAAFLVLGMQGPYYLAPVDLIAVLYLGRLVARQRPRSLATSLLVVALTLQNLMGSLYHVVERKNIMQARARMAHVIRDRAQESGGEPLQLFFPHAQGYHIMGFGAYLSHLGLQIVGREEVAGERAPSVLLASPRAFPTGLCDPHRRQIPCVQRSDPAPGALVVHLPDDAPPAGWEEEPEDPSEVVFRYRPFLVSEEVVPFFSLFRRTSLAFQTRPLPSTWLTARVVLKAAERPGRLDPGRI